MKRAHESNKIVTGVNHNTIKKYTIRYCEKPRSNSPSMPNMHTDFISSRFFPFFFLFSSLPFFSSSCTTSVLYLPRCRACTFIRNCYLRDSPRILCYFCIQTKVLPRIKLRLTNTMHQQGRAETEKCNRKEGAVRYA